jgi:hypothetical protein
LKLISTNFVTGRDTNEMVLQQSLFNSSDYMYWKVDFTVITHFVNSFGIDETLNSSSSLTLKLNQIPINGSCEVNLKNGTAMYTLFTFMCYDWNDVDGRVARYEFLGNLSKRNFNYK